MINFVGHSSHAELPLGKCENFEKKYEAYCNTKKRSLLNAIALAKKINKGEIPYKNGEGAQILENSSKKIVKLTKLVKLSKDRNCSNNNIMQDRRLLLNKRKRSTKNGKLVSKHSSDSRKDLEYLNMISMKRSASNLSTNSRSICGNGRPSGFVNYSSDEDLDKGSFKLNNNRINNNNPTGRKGSNHLVNNKNEELNNKIQELILSKVELPCTTSYKHLFTHIEAINELINKVKITEVYEVTLNLLR